MRIGTGTYTNPIDGLLYKKVLISECAVGIYLRWWFNGWHYFNFSNGYEISMQTEATDFQVTKMFSVISKIERDAKIKSDYSYQVTLEGIQAQNVPGFSGLIQAEKVEQYEDLVWREVFVTRGAHIIRDENSPAFILNFEITRKERIDTSSVYQKSLKLYLDTTLCDMDDDEVIPVNKQTNDIAEMQDRQSDFTQQFRIRKTRAMMLLFELSGEVGANTDLPYKNQVCRLVQDGIEMITDGIMILDRVDDYYYYVSIYSGNLNFFKEIASLKLTDLALDTAPSDCQHTWNLTDIEASHTSDLNYVYPLVEPSEDGSIVQENPGTETINLYAGWVWPFVKVKAIWDEIFTNAAFTPSGNILTNDTFLRLFMPIVNLKPSNTDKYLYSLRWQGSQTFGDHTILPGGTLINGTAVFATGHYLAPFDGTYVFRVTTVFPTSYPAMFLYKNGVQEKVFDLTYDDATTSTHEVSVTVVSGNDLTVYTSGNTFFEYTIAIIDITATKIGYGAAVDPSVCLPDLIQVDFIKTICNMFALIPEVIPRDRTIHFWSYLDLYDNIPLSRDWSKYLSEREDETEFKFGDYAQNNYLRYKDSDDVLKDEGRGNMQINDETLPLEKDVVTLPVSTCDQVYLDPSMIGEYCSRIGFNEYDPDTDTYKSKETIDARIVYIKALADASPPIKTLQFRDNVVFGAGSAVDIANPKKATSTEVSFSSLVTYYAGLSRMLTKTNLRRAKFNLPVYEVAGLKHYIPIWLSQYKSYFYVNKINNYIPGNLCTIDLIKL
jgi:hypothetical protein